MKDEKNGGMVKGCRLNCYFELDVPKEYMDVLSLTTVETSDTKSDI